MAKLHPGDLLAGRYRIVRLLGQGGMSTVFLADDTKLGGKLWAVKEQRLGLKEAGQFAAEAAIMAKLNHELLPQIVDYYPPDEDGMCYVVMDYIPGETLHALFERAGRRMPAERVAYYAAQLCELFRYLHGRPEPVVYRDLKPSNVMIDDQGKVKLIDFGIARSYKTGREEDTVRLGTFGFAAPEQFEGKQSDGRTDLYTLGALMYYLLSGGEYYAVVRRKAGQLGPHVPGPLAAIVDTLLQPDPERRYQLAEDVLLELNRLFGGSGRQGDGQQQAASGRADALAGKQAEQRNAAGSGVPVVPRLIAFTSLYTGAGVTFAALAAAKALAARGFECAVLECPRERPELHALLFGERRAPDQYRFYTDADGGGERGEAGLEWRDGGVSWYTLPPGGGDTAGWTAERRIRLIYRMRKPFVIADASDALAGQGSDALLEDADALVVVIDPLLHKWCGPHAEAALQRALEAGRAGKPVHWVVNRAVRSPGFAEWLKLLPEKPVCCLPDLGFAAFAEASWNGELVHDRPEAKRLLTKAVGPLIDGWVKAQERGPAGGISRTLFGKAW